MRQNGSLGTGHLQRAAEERRAASDVGLGGLEGQAFELVLDGKRHCLSRGRSGAYTARGTVLAADAVEHTRQEAVS